MKPLETSLEKPPHARAAAPTVTSQGEDSLGLATTIGKEFEQLQLKDIFKIENNRNILDPVHSFISQDFLGSVQDQFKQKDMEMPAKLSQALEQEIAFQSQESMRIETNIDNIEFLDYGHEEEAETVAEGLARVLEMSDDELREKAKEPVELPLLIEGGPNNFIGSAIYLAF
mmetsp:Transcript_17623/g.27272  ORF Transcript_17623/g.27272 Transcript_17623/m.27272 type:complete len:172 (+) Transcript_17623:939-1454(+)